MLQAMLKHCLEHASGNALACRRVGRRTSYGEHEQIMRGRGQSCGSTGLIFERRVCRWSGLSGSAGLPWPPTKPPRDAKSIFVSSSCLVPLFETASCFRALKRANSKRIAKKLVQNLIKNAFWPTPMRDPSHVSCLVSPSHRTDYLVCHKIKSTIFTSVTCAPP
jgi:hypothetical protein